MRDSSYLGMRELLLVTGRITYLKLALVAAFQQQRPTVRVCFAHGLPPATERFLAEQALALPRLSPDYLEYEAVQRCWLLGDTEELQHGPWRKLADRTEPCHLLDEHGVALPEPLTLLQAWQVLERHQALSPAVRLLLRLAWEESPAERSPERQPLPQELADLGQAALPDSYLHTYLPHTHAGQHLARIHRLLTGARTVSLHGANCVLLPVAEPISPNERDALLLGILKECDAHLLALLFEEPTGTAVWLASRTHRCDADELASALAQQLAAQPEGPARLRATQPLPAVMSELRQLLPLYVRREASIADIMSHPVRTISHQVGISEALTAMNRAHVDALIVTIGEEQEFWGVLSRQVADLAIAHGYGSEPLSTIAQTDPGALNPMTRLSKALPRVLEGRQKFWPVVEGARPVGVVTDWNVHEAIRAGLWDSPGLHEGSSVGRAHLGALHRRRNIAGLVRKALPEDGWALLSLISEQLETAGLSGYLVGGVVRDVFLGHVNQDLDIVVAGDGLAFAKRVARAVHGKHIPISQFGTAKVVLPGGGMLDVAGARTEYYPHPGALPVVEPGSFYDDMYRRDFTVNAMAMSLNRRTFGQLEDALGGEDDLVQGVLRLHHPLSFLEDPTRILRGVRFASRFGFRFSFDSERFLEEALRLECFARISGERLLTELRFLLKSPQRAAAFRMLRDTGTLAALGLGWRMEPATEALFGALPRLLAWYEFSGCQPSIEPWVLALSALSTELDPEGARQLCERLHLTRELSRKVADSAERAWAVAEALGARLRPSALVLRLHDCEPETVLVGAALSGQSFAWETAARYLKSYREVAPSTTGRELLALGLAPGPRFRELLDGLREGRLDGWLADQADEAAWLEAQ